MTDYELGFARGEREAWNCRAEPLPKPPAIIADDAARGYWDARLPRTSEWARRHQLPSAWWDPAARIYVSPVASLEAA